MEISGCFVPPQGQVVLGDPLRARGARRGRRARGRNAWSMGWGRVLELPSGQVVASGFARPAGVLASTRRVNCTSPTAAATHSSGIGAARPEVARGPGLGSRELTKPRGLCELQEGACW
ncbi:MAG: hypothetical protein IPK67_14400 [Planctomycetes bacterium]|nr:hypothetical protein [Planctomycetota bacterium]